MKDYPCERIYRDARIMSIYEGTSQLQVVAAINGITKGSFLEQIDRYAAEVYGEELQGEWWQMYDDPTLDSLVRHALERNRNLAIAASKIEAAQYALSQARAEFLPELGVDAQGEVKGVRSEREYEFALQPTVSWNVSPMGNLAHSE